MSRSRMPLVLGLGAAGGIGYYLYSAGGNAKAAEAKFESMDCLTWSQCAMSIYSFYWRSNYKGDADRVAAKIKGKLPGESPNAEKDFKNLGQEAGAKLDKAVRPILSFLF